MQDLAKADRINGVYSKTLTGITCYRRLFLDAARFWKQRLSFPHVHEFLHQWLGEWPLADSQVDFPEHERLLQNAEACVPPNHEFLVFFMPLNFKPVQLFHFDAFCV